MISTLHNSINNLSGFCSLMRLASKMYHANPQNLAVKNMDITNNDILNLFSSLNKHHVKYLLVGGLAGVFHGHIRTTQDLDLWIQSAVDNRERFIAALKENDVIEANYLKKTPFVFGYTAVKFGTSGFELDLGDDLTLFKQIDFDACYSRASTGNIDGIPFNVIHINDLIREKEKVGRAKDIGDAEALKEIRDAKVK